MTISNSLVINFIFEFRQSVSECMKYRHVPSNPTNEIKQVLQTLREASCGLKISTLHPCSQLSVSRVPSGLSKSLDKLRVAT